MVIASLDAACVLQFENVTDSVSRPKNSSLAPLGVFHITRLNTIDVLHLPLSRAQNGTVVLSRNTLLPQQRGIFLNKVLGLPACVIIGDQASDPKGPELVVGVRMAVVWLVLVQGAAVAGGLAQTSASWHAKI